MVLTVENIPDHALTRDYVVHLKDCFGQLRRLKFARKWSGFYTVQITNSGRGFHVHIHALIGLPFVDINQVREEWMRLTKGAGRIVKLVTGHHDFGHLVRYVAKPSEIVSWTPAQVGGFARAFENVKTFSTFGSLWSLRTKYSAWLRETRAENRKCSCCGHRHFHFYTEADFRSKNPMIRPDWMNLPPPPPTPCSIDSTLPYDILRGLQLVPASQVYPRIN